MYPIITVFDNRYKMNKSAINYKNQENIFTRHCIIKNYLTITITEFLKKSYEINTFYLAIIYIIWRLTIGLCDLILYIYVLQL